MQREFQNEAIRILASEDPTEPKRDEIPDDIRRELHLPQNMMIYGINFTEVRRHDVSKKKFTPQWSG
jgi:hypothetical protein